MLKIKFDRLDYQERAVNSISDVFKNIAFVSNENRKSNPSFDLQNSKNILVQNIIDVRASNKVEIGEISIKDELVIDTLMETGTGKTFTFLESVYRLNRDYGLSKFIILVPSNPIRQGTIKNINITKEFFVKEYGKHVSVYNYSEKTVLNYINSSEQNISVLVSTYQSFNKATNSINKSKIEQSLIGRAKSYMQALAQLRPVIIIDEPHRFEGKQTAKYLSEFNALFTLRFGATYKGDEYKNLIYTLDSVDAFSRGLVKAISVDTVGNENVDAHTIELKEVKGANQKNYVAKIEYKDINSKSQTIELELGENLGEKSGIEYLTSYVVERITKEDENFDFVNELFVVVPSTEKDFVSSIQNEISQNSIRQVSKVFNEDTMVDNAITTTARNAVKLLDTLAEMGFISISDEDISEIVLSKEQYSKRAKELERLDVKGCDNEKLKEYFDSFYQTTSRIKAKDRSALKEKGKIKIHQENFAKFRKLWDILNHDAVVKYDINSELLVQKAKEKINRNFMIEGQDIIIKRDKNIENKEKHDSQRESVTVQTHSIFTLYEFVKALSNNTKLSMQTVAKVLSEIDKEKFALVPKNENFALKKIEEQLISAIYETIINKISYDLKEIKTCNTSLTDEKGTMKDFIYSGSLGVESYKISKKSIKAKSIYDEDFMEVDSEIEKSTIDESDDKRIIVFGKLPRVNIPTAHGKNYNPDFGYVIEENDKKELYFVVETKGYDTFDAISDSEKLKIKSAEAFFKELQKKGFNVKYKPKLNSPELTQMISDIILD